MLIMLSGSRGSTKDPHWLSCQFFCATSDRILVLQIFLLKENAFRGGYRTSILQYYTWYCTNSPDDTTWLETTGSKRTNISILNSRIWNVLLQIQNYHCIQMSLMLLKHTYLKSTWAPVTVGTVTFLQLWNRCSESKRSYKWLRLLKTKPLFYKRSWQQWRESLVQLVLKVWSSDSWGHSRPFEEGLQGANYFYNNYLHSNTCLFVFQRLNDTWHHCSES